MEFEGARGPAPNEDTASARILLCSYEDGRSARILRILALPPLLPFTRVDFLQRMTGLVDQETTFE